MSKRFCLKVTFYLDRGKKFSKKDSCLHDESLKYLRRTLCVSMYVKQSIEHNLVVKEVQKILPNSHFITRNIASNAPNIFIRWRNAGIISNSVDERTAIETTLPTIPKSPKNPIMRPSIRNLIISNILHLQQRITKDSLE